jgi:hypothetical protein
VRGIGTGGGFKMMVQDRSGQGYRALEQATFGMMMQANQQPGLTSVFTLFNTGTPRIFVDRSREGATARCEHSRVQQQYSHPDRIGGARRAGREERHSHCRVRQTGGSIGQDPLGSRRGACTRLRPILMTSFAFILGVVPLAIASGPGAEMRQALGTAVFSGMIGVTVFGLLFTPVLDVIASWAATKMGKPIASPGPDSQPAAALPAVEQSA